jgi:hypothetical protein
MNGPRSFRLRLATRRVGGARTAVDGSMGVVGRLPFPFVVSSTAGNVTSVCCANLSASSLPLFFRLVYLIALD